MLITSGSVPGELLGDREIYLRLGSNFEANRDLPEDLLSCETLLVVVAQKRGVNLRIVAERRSLFKRKNPVQASSREMALRFRI